MIHGKVDVETEKAIRISCGKHSCWFPVAALVEPEKIIPGLTYDWFKLAKWFRPDGYQKWFMDRYSTVSRVSA